MLNYLSENREAQMERDQLQELAALIEAEKADAQDTEAYKAGFSKLMERVDQAESERLRFASLEENKNGSSLFKRLGVGLAASLVLGVGAITIQQFRAPGAETLSVPSATEQAAKPYRLTVAFDESADSETLRATFVQTGAYIVSGPDGEGRYVIEVVHQGDGLLQSMSNMDGVKYVAFQD